MSRACIVVMRLILSMLLASTNVAFAEGIQYPPDFFQQFALYQPVERLSGSIRVLDSPILDVVFRRVLDEFAKFYPQLDLDLDVTQSSRANVPDTFLTGKAAFIGVLTPLSAQQLAQFEERFGYRPQLIKFAVAAIGIFVSEKNPVQGLTLQQLDAIFSAERKRGAAEALKWGDVGVQGEWEGRRIVTFGYRGSIGFYDWFRESVLLGAPAKGTMREQLSDSGSIQGVGVDQNGIAYANLLLATERTRFLPLAAKDGRYTLPTHEACVKQTYPLCRFIYVYANAGNKGRLAPAEREFLAFLLSREGQIAVADGAQYPVSPQIASTEVARLKAWPVNGKSAAASAQ